MPEMSSGYAGGGIVRTYGADTGSASITTSVTTANTKDSWTELVSSTAYDANWIMVRITNAQTGSRRWMVDIGIGAATEQVLIANLFAAIRTTGDDTGHFLFPVFIPKGSRLTTRAQSSGSSGSIGVSVLLIAGTVLAGGVPGSVSTYGAGTGTTLGVNLDPGATPDTDTAWTEITSATDRDHHWLVLALWAGDGALNSTQVFWRVSIGIGAATEEVLIPDIHLSGSSITDQTTCPVLCFPVFVPKGSRLTAKVRSSSGQVGDRGIYMTIYGAG